MTESDKSRGRVLVAEDDPELRAVMVEALRLDGFDVIEAEDGAQLLDLVGPSLFGKEIGPPPALVISDHRMPGLTGLTVLGGLRQLDSKLPFILITAFGDVETHVQAERLGACVLDKPFEMRRLVGLAHQCLGVHP
jgi:DNA-binding NtrC family response regulator